MAKPKTNDRATRNVALTRMRAYHSAVQKMLSVRTPHRDYTESDGGIAPTKVYPWRKPFQ